MPSSRPMCRRAGPVFDADFVRAHADEMERAYALLADEQSRQVFLDTVRFKLSGRLCYLRASETDKEEIFRTVLRPTGRNTLPTSAHTTATRSASCCPTPAGRLPPLPRSSPTGAASASCPPGRRTACPVMLRWCRRARGMRTPCSAFPIRRGGQSRVAARGRETAMRALDSVLAGRPCTYLKMDVEGAEREAIAGAIQTIRQYRPRLNIAAYHRSADFFQLRCSSTRCARRIACICGTIPMCPRGTRIYMRPVRKKMLVIAGDRRYNEDTVFSLKERITMDVFTVTSTMRRAKRS